MNHSNVSGVHAIKRGENKLKLGNWVIVIKMYFKLEISFGSDELFDMCAYGAQSTD